MLIPIFLLATALQQQPAPTRVIVTPANPSVIAGDSLQLRAQAVDAQGQPVSGVRILFAPAGMSFEASVDSAGMVRAGAVGMLPVSAVAMVVGSRPITQRVEVRIVPGPAARIAVNPGALKLLAGQRFRLHGVSYSSANDRRDDRVSWSSSATRVVQVSGAGVVTAMTPGRATLTAAAGNARESIPVEVVSADVSAIEVSPSGPTARTGDVVRFRVVVKDANGREIAGLTPTWLVSPGAGLIDDGGAFVGNRAGMYQITASFGRRTADATVTLTPRDVHRQVKVVGKVLRSDLPTSEAWVHPNGRVAYLGTTLGGDRVYAIDISNPANPVIVDSIVVNARGINDVMTTADGNYLVITREGAADRKNGIVIADVRDPLHPKALSEFTEGVTAGVHSVFVHTQPRHGTHVYLTNDGTGAMHIIDINDPAKPKEVAQWKPRASSGGMMLHDIDVQNGIVYASWWNDGLVMLDVGNGVKGGTPAKPALIAQFKYDLDSLYRRVAVHSGDNFVRGTHTAWRHKNYVFIADEVFGMADLMAMQGGHSRAFGRLHVLDVADLEKPRMVAWYEPEYGGVHNIWVAGDTLYVGAYNAGFKAFDVSGELRGDLLLQGRLLGDYLPMDPKGKVPNMPMTWGVIVNPKDNLAYVPDINSGLWILRLEPRSPIVP
jgi:hypothetical protein